MSPPGQGPRWARVPAGLGSTARPGSPAGRQAGRQAGRETDGRINPLRALPHRVRMRIYALYTHVLVRCCLCVFFKVGVMSNLL